MSSVDLNGSNFTFFPPGLIDGEAEYRAMCTGGGVLYTVVLNRIGNPDLPPIGFDVPRRVAERRGYDNPQDVVRDAIGQAMRDGLFNAHPHETVYLDDDAPRWGGNLNAVE